MSFNLNDNIPIISRDNYEEYLLLYVDDELNAQERCAVEAFLVANPDLQAELDALISTKLEPELFSFDHKENLFAANMGEAAIDETLLLHIDNELAGAEKEAVDKRLQKDEKYSRQHQLLLRTKSDPAEVVPHPNKEELYRHTEHRIGYRFALRIAAAVLILASLAVVYIAQKDGDAPLATNNNSNAPAVVKPDVQVNKQSEDRPAKQLQPLQNKAEQKTELAIAPRTKKIKTLPAAKAPATKRQTVVAPQEDKVEEEALIAYEEAVHLPNRTEEAIKPATGGKKEEKNLTAGVTTKKPQTYNTTEAAAEPQFASAKDDNKSGGGLKGFLRKATRMVERRTGISATNDNNELLIGAVAIQL